MAKPKLLALIAAILTTGILIFIFALPDVFLFHFLHPQKLIIAGALIFSVSFLVFLFIIEKFIYKKIKAIDRNIKSQFISTASPQLSNDALEELSTEVQRWSHERKEEIERLKKLETYRREFLGNVSHELKTPVFNIQGYVLTLLDGGLEDKNINRDYLLRAEKSVERMIGIIEDLESITQLEAGELQLEMEQFDIVSLAREIMDSLEMKAGEKKIKFSLNVFDEKPVFVQGDRFRIRQVLSNLILNSVKYGKQNGETRVSFHDAGENIVVEVADNGIGIAKEHLPRIFERFYRIDKSRSREQGGTGLGLAIVKHIIEAHGQTINVLSTPDAGSVFSFTLRKG